MNIQAKIKADVERCEPGKLFSYQELPSYKLYPDSTIKVVGQLVKNGQLRRYSKGVFYRARLGILGEMSPFDSEKIKISMYKNGRLTGYVTGISLYNRLGLTTQVPRTITVATERTRQRKELGNIEIKLVPAKAPVSEKNKNLLELLDVFNDIKHIPDSPPTEILQRLREWLIEFDETSVNKIIDIAKKYYPPATRALLGLVLDSLGISKSEMLLESLNPTSRYRIGLHNSWIGSKKWNIE